VRLNFRKPSLPIMGEGSTEGGSLADTTLGSGGVLAMARREGLYRNWRSPPGPEEKDLGER
jgi:hypothetical protein